MPAVAAGAVVVAVSALVALALPGRVLGQRLSSGHDGRRTLEVGDERQAADAAA